VSRKRRGARVLQDVDPGTSLWRDAASAVPRTLLDRDVVDHEERPSSPPRWRML